MNRKIMVPVLVAVVVLAIFVFSVLQFGEKNDLVHPRIGSVVESVYGLGTVTANRSYDLKVAITTGIRRLYVQEGDIVKEGDRLIEFEESGLRKAPFSGTVTAVKFKIGETIFPQTTILSLVDLNDRYVSVSLEQQGALRVTAGQKALLSFESIRGQKFEGVVRAIYPSEGQFIVRIDLQKLPTSILPGMTADVAIEVGGKDSALLVPVASISSGKVIVKNGAQSKKVDVRLGIIDGEWAEVTSGDVSSADNVVVRRKK